MKISKANNFCTNEEFRSIDSVLSDFLNVLHQQRIDGWFLSSVNHFWQWRRWIIPLIINLIELIDLVILTNDIMEWTGSVNHWFRGRSLPVVGCCIFPFFLNGWRLVNLIQEDVVFLKWGKVVFIGTYIWPICVVMKLFVLNNNWLFITSSHWGGRVMTEAGLRSQVEVNGDEGKILFVVGLFIWVFFDFLNGGEIINWVMMRLAIFLMTINLLVILIVCLE